MNRRRNRIGGSVTVKTTSKSTSRAPVGRKFRLKTMTRSMMKRANSRIRKA
jgi:hypothetical protein